MNALKKYAGLLWLTMAAVVGYYGIMDFGLPKLGTGKAEDLVFGIIILFILMPIIVGGLLTFGWYAWQGEYDE